MTQRPATTDQRPTAILLAAGESTRMGQPKAFLPWGDTTLLDYQVGQLAEAGCADIVVVLGHDAEALRPHVPPPGRAAVNEAYHEGRASSLRAGAAAIADGSGPIAVLSVDQPRPAKITSTLLAGHRAARKDVTLPLADGRHGHPAVLSRTLLPELRAASDETEGLRGVIEAHRDSVHEVHFMLHAHESMLAAPDFTALFVHVDINTPEDYEQALELLRLLRSAD